MNERIVVSGFLSVLVAASGPAGTIIVDGQTAIEDVEFASISTFAIRISSIHRFSFAAARRRRKAAGRVAG